MTRPVYRTNTPYRIYDFWQLFRGEERITNGAIDIMFITTSVFSYFFFFLLVIIIIIIIKKNFFFNGKRARRQRTRTLTILRTHLGYRRLMMPGLITRTQQRVLAAGSSYPDRTHTWQGRVLLGRTDSAVVLLLFACPRSTTRVLHHTHAARVCIDFRAVIGAQQRGRNAALDDH